MSSNSGCVDILDKKEHQSRLYQNTTSLAIPLINALYVSLPPYTLGSSVLKHFQHTETLKKIIINNSSEDTRWPIKHKMM